MKSNHNNRLKYEQYIFWLVVVTLICTWLIMYQLQRIDVTSEQAMKAIRDESQQDKHSSLLKMHMNDLHMSILERNKEESAKNLARAKRVFNNAVRSTHGETALTDGREHPLDAMFGRILANMDNETFAMPPVFDKNKPQQAAAAPKTPYAQLRLKNKILEALNVEKPEIPIAAVLRTAASLQDINKRYHFPPNKLEHLFDQEREQLRSHWLKTILPMSLELRPKDPSYQINETFSDHTSFDRTHTDLSILPQDCPEVTKYDGHLPMASVVIPLYNEVLSMVLRTVHSILNNSPPKLLGEIILIDDASSNLDLKDPLDAYLKKLPKVRVIHNNERQGLIRSRLIGAEFVETEVVIFQDAHTESIHGWLQPLLAYLKANPEAIVQPDIDELTADALMYNVRNAVVQDFKSQLLLRGGFNWDLRFAWVRMTHQEMDKRKTAGEPYRTYSLVGCSIAIYKKHFYKIGAFDQGMNIWGGENIELAFRNWMCGGSVMTVPCSHVAHVFKPFSYDFDGNREQVVGYNLMRIAEIWMDDYKKYFYASWRAYPFKRSRLTREHRKSIKERRAVTRDAMQCRDFEWFMTNVANDIFVPPENAVLYGEVFNENSMGCFAMLKDGIVGLHFNCFPTRILPEHEFFIDKSGNMRWMLARDRCIGVEETTGFLKLEDCKPINFPHWLLQGETTQGHILVTIPGEFMNEQVYCLQQVTTNDERFPDSQMPQLQNCNWHDPWQSWWFQYKFDYSA